MQEKQKEYRYTPSGTVFWWEQDLSEWLELEEDGCVEVRVIHSD